MTVLCPGPVPSEFRERATGDGKGPYPPLVTQSAEQVAADGYDGLKAGRRLVVPGIGNKLITSCFIPRGPGRWWRAAISAQT